MAKKKKTVQRPGKAKPRCDQCGHYDCSNGKDCFSMRDAFIARYKKDPHLLKISKSAARVEAKHYGAATRLEEIALFAKEAGFTHLGVAYCTGFRAEAKAACEMLRTRFKVTSVCCKNGGIPKETLGFPHVRSEGSESICNPLGQAELLNRAGSELNIVVGLCVGHDALFNRESKALVTTFVVKDRVLAHNPVGAVYCPYVARRLREGLFAE